MVEKGGGSEMRQGKSVVKANGRLEIDHRIIKSPRMEKTIIERPLRYCVLDVIVVKVNVCVMLLMYHDWEIWTYLYFFHLFLYARSRCVYSLFRNTSEEKLVAIVQNISESFCLLLSIFHLVVLRTQ